MTARLLCALLTVVAGCYDIPKPECGFVCGPSAACPSEYTCNATDNRCHLDGSSVICAAGFDAGTDAGDRTAPEVITFSPAQGAEDVLLDARIVVTFSERVVGASSVTILLDSPAGPVPTDVEFDLVSNTATVTPMVLLARSTTYTATVTDDLIDLAGNPPLGPTDWQFTTSTPPRVTSQSPLHLASALPVDTVVIAEFNEQIFGVTGVSFTLRSNAGAVNGSLSITNLNKRVTFTPLTQLAADTSYTATLSPAISDVVGNPLVGAPVTWSFTTGADAIAPMIVSRFPEVDRFDVPVTTSIIVGFDEPVTVDASSFTLTSMGGTPVPATIVISMGGRTASLRPDPDLLPITPYTATLTAAITDSSGNVLVGAPMSWSFTTGDPIAPRVVSIDLATGVPVSSTIKVQFDEPVLNVTTASFTVNGSAITGTIAMSAGDTIATFTPDAALPASATITVILTIDVQDLAGNPLMAPVMFSFMTAP